MRDWRRSRSPSLGYVASTALLAKCGVVSRLSRPELRAHTNRTTATTRMTEITTPRTVTIGFCDFPVDFPVVVATAAILAEQPGVSTVAPTAAGSLRTWPRLA